MSTTNRSPKILDLDATKKMREELRAQGKTLVQCHGCFDIVHPGHIRYLRFAKGLGDKLIVTVSSDASVDKGYDRPYIAQDLRLDNLAAFEFVDYVCLSEADWGGPILDAVRPDVYVKGREYESNDDPRFAKEKALVEDHGGRVVFSSGDVVFSSTELIRHHRARMNFNDSHVKMFCERNNITRKSMTELIRACRKVRVAVFGDPILDQYVHCGHAQVASEGPILSVSPIAEDWYVGGAGLIARQMASIGAHVRFITTTGPEEHQERMAAGLSRAGVELELIECQRPIYVKTRYIVDGQKVFKVDHSHAVPLPSNAIESALKSLRSAFIDTDGVVVTDFGYGLFGDRLAKALPELAAESKTPYFADVSTNGRSNLLKFRAPRIVTPTEDELRFALGDNESGLAPLASRYYRESDAQGLVITLGQRGAVSFEPPVGEQRLRSDYLPALAAIPVDAVGAGDRFLSGLVLAELAHFPREHGMYLGATLAAQGVMYLGNETVNLGELERHLERQPELEAS